MEPDIAALAQIHVGDLRRLYVAPDIPADKERRVRAVHERFLRAHEPIVVLYDNTVFGGAADGFAMTPRGIAWKEFLADPRFLYWNTLAPEAVRRRERDVYLAGGRLPLTVLEEEHAEALAALLSAIISARKGDRGGPYRAANARPGRVIPMAELVELIGAHLAGADRVYIGEEVPARKARNVRRLHAAIESDEPIAALYDDTVFGSAKEGFAITPRRLCWKNVGESPVSMQWHEICADTVGAAPREVIVGGGVIEVMMVADHAERIAALVRALAHRALGPP